MMFLLVREDSAAVSSDHGFWLVVPEELAAAIASWSAWSVRGAFFQRSSVDMSRFAALRMLASKLSFLSFSSTGGTTKAPTGGGEPNKYLRHASPGTCLSFSHRR